MESDAVVPGKSFNRLSKAEPRPAVRMVSVGQGVENLLGLLLRAALGIRDQRQELGAFPSERSRRKTRLTQALKQHSQAERPVRRQDFHGPAAGVQAQRAADILD